MPDVTITVDNETIHIFNRDDPNMYNIDARDTNGYYLGDGLGGALSFYWHISELNTETIKSYCNEGFKYIFFVKNTFDEATVKTVKEIFAYNRNITDPTELSRVYKYLGLDNWDDTDTWNDDDIWID
jgi:hypothetical protein